MKGIQTMKNCYEKQSSLRERHKTLQIYKTLFYKNKLFLKFFLPLG